MNEKKDLKNKKSLLKKEIAHLTKWAISHFKGVWCGFRYGEGSGYLPN